MEHNELHTVISCMIISIISLFLAITLIALIPFCSRYLRSFGTTQEYQAENLMAPISEDSANAVAFGKEVPLARVCDDCDVLTNKEESALQQRIETINQKYDCQIYVIVTDKIINPHETHKVASIKNLTEYLEVNLGVDTTTSNSSAILYTPANSSDNPRDAWQICSWGLMRTAENSSDNDSFRNQHIKMINNDFDKGHPYEGFSTYLNYIDNLLARSDVRQAQDNVSGTNKVDESQKDTRSISNEAITRPLPEVLKLSFITALIISCLYMGSLYNKMKTTGIQIDADTYHDEYSEELLSSTNIYRGSKR